ncbi:hypothetical protein V6N12_068277 [Hibiscus sabdariffa]|uniref:Uncharacterized protein n=1 Tax=Hibiscus sabdariffa TaxID=183260 RepID=A0ABR2FPI0_9ROSI
MDKLKPTADVSARSRSVLVLHGLHETSSTEVRNEEVTTTPNARPLYDSQLLGASSIPMSTNDQHEVLIHSDAGHIETVSIQVEGSLTKGSCSTMPSECLESDQVEEIAQSEVCVRQEETSDNCNNTIRSNNNVHPMITR